MANNTSPAEARIEQLEQIEEDVINILKTSGNCLLEIAKDRPSQKQVDSFVNTGIFHLFTCFLSVAQFQSIFYSHDEHQKC